MDYDFGTENGGAVKIGEQWLSIEIGLQGVSGSLNFRKRAAGLTIMEI
jgi:hypothetical protein